MGIFYNLKIMAISKGILFIDPKGKKSQVPVIDEATRKMTAAIRLSKPGVLRRGMEIRGIHKCVCGAISPGHNFVLPNNEETNALCVHYLAYHRSDVPREQLEKVLKLEYGESEPTTAEMSGQIKTESSTELKKTTKKFGLH